MNNQKLHGRRAYAHYSRPTHSRQQTGRQGEQWAVDYLRTHGYTILDRNVYLRWAEIDIIARRRGTIHFFEVKTRRSHHHGRPVAAVSLHKIQRLQTAARYYVAQRNLPYEGLAIGVIECWLEETAKLGARAHDTADDVTDAQWKIRCIPNVVI